MIGNKILKFMKKYNLSQTPENYCLLYHYFQNNDYFLKKILNEQIQNKKINDNILNNIFKKYFIENKIIKLNTFIKDFYQNIDETETKIKNIHDSCKEKHDKINNLLNEQKMILNKNQNLFTLFNLINFIFEQHFNTLKLLNSSKEKINKLKNEINLLQNEAYLDPLTEIFNRRKFFKEIEKITNDYNYYKKIFICIMDIDDFKKINDNFGHKIGDSVLRYIAKKIKETIREHDVLARYGGEEFILALTKINYPDTEIIKIIKRIKENISNNLLKIIYSNEIIGKVTLSYGIFQYIPGLYSIEQTIEFADKLLYKAKKNGKNKGFYLNTKNKEIEII